MRYLILAPGQARRIRPLEAGEWQDVSDGRIDTRRAYRALVRDPDGSVAGSIAVFFYDGALSAGISFHHFLRSAPELADRMAANGTGEADLAHVATDGEVYGHHEPFGDMCLAYLTRREAPARGIRVTNYGEYLDRHPPTHEVALDFGPAGAGSSWSCAHGVARWREDCGCSTGGRPGWSQRWRSPLRAALDALRDRLAAVYEERAGELLTDPWRARDEAIDLILDPRHLDRFLDRHARKPLDDADRAAVLSLVDSQHHAMLMFTSCAWFFADLAGVEVRQNLAFAARAIERVRAYGGEGIERDLLERLAAAEGNRRQGDTGADLYRRVAARMRGGEAAEGGEGAPGRDPAPGEPLEALLERHARDRKHLLSSQAVAKLVEDRFASLLDRDEARPETIRDSLALLERVERCGLEFDRTRLEECVYALLLSYRTARAARLAGRSEPASGDVPEELIRLAERTNVSPDPLGPDSFAQDS